jgi:hypothetical protein
VFPANHFVAERALTRIIVEWAAGLVEKALQGAALIAPVEEARDQGAGPRHRIRQTTLSISTNVYCIRYVAADRPRRGSRGPLLAARSVAWRPSFHFQNVSVRGLMPSRVANRAAVSPLRCHRAAAHYVDQRVRKWGARKSDQLRRRFIGRWPEVLPFATGPTSLFFTSTPGLARLARW